MVEEDVQIDLLSGAKKAFGFAMLVMIGGGMCSFESARCGQSIIDYTGENGFTKISFYWSAELNGPALVVGCLMVVAALATLAMALTAKPFEELSAEASGRLKRGKLLLAVAALGILGFGGSRIYNARPFNHEIDTRTLAANERDVLDRFNAADSCAARYEVLKPYADKR